MQAGIQLVLSHNSKLALNQSLQRQGLGGQRAQISATYMPVNLLAALRFAHGCNVEDEEFTLNGITEMKGVSQKMPTLLHNLPKSLRTWVQSGTSSCEISGRPAKLDFWRPVQSEPGRCDMASRPSKFDFWLGLRSEPGPSDMASMPSEFDFWASLQSEPGQRDMASRPSKFDFW